MRSTARRGAGGFAVVDVTVVIWSLAVGGGEAQVPIHLWNLMLVAGAVAAITWVQLMPQGGDEYVRGVRDGMGPLPPL